MPSWKNIPSESDTAPLSAERDRPMMYPGTPVDHQSVSSVLPNRNRRSSGSRRTMSPSTILLTLIGLAVAIVLYISNIIAVNQLLGEVNRLEAEHQQILMEQERLKAQINRMASLERIQEMAETELGLTSLREPPVWLEIDRGLLQELEEGERP